MAGPRDVIRHVILKILVDQEGLAESLAAARAKLKALKDAEKDINKERGKGADDVTKAYDRQNKSVDDNTRAHEANRRARTTTADDTGKVKADTAAINENTEATKRQTVEEAKAEAVRRKARQDELDAQQKRRERRRQDADDAAQDAAKADQKLQNAARRAYQEREQAAEAHEQKLANTQAKVHQNLGQSGESHEQRLANQQRAAEDKAAESAQRLANIRQQGEDQAARAANARQHADEAASRRAEVDAEKLAAIQQANAVKEVGAAQKVEQAERAAAQKREQSATSFEQTQATRQRDADRRNQQSTEQFLANEARKQAAAEETNRRKNEESSARVETTNARTEDIVSRATDAQQIRDSTRDVRQQAVTDRATSQSTVAQANASAAQSREAVAATRELTAEEQRLSAETTRQNRALSEQESLRQRRVATTRQIRALENDVTKASQQGELLEQRIAAAAEARARAAEREATANRRRQTSLGAIGAVVSDVAVAGIRAVPFVGSAARASSRRAADTRANTSDLEAITRKATTVTGRVEKLFGDLGKRISRSVGDGAEDAASKLGRITQRVRGYIDSVNRPRVGGSGNSLFNDLITNISNLGNKLGGALSDGTRHLVSFQSLVIAVIAALGPLAAILGAVGAAALGLASNMAALSGVLFAIPGILGALVSGFGALALVMGPLKNVFSEYSAAQKEATQTTTAATDAVNDYKIAQDNAQQAEIDWKRAQADAPRAVQALADARKDATRQIEDYRDALKKLRFDEEGANLGVRSAEQAARRALADPTANSLDRDVALHNVQGALFDQQDQAKNARRTRQDAAEAFKKGVDGADAVVAANREVEDSARKIDLAYLQWQKDLAAVAKAKTAADAGGTAAAAFQKDMDKLPPQTRKVAQAILDLRKGPFKDLRNDLSEDIFGPISGSTGKFKEILGSLRDFLEPAAIAIGRLAKNALDLLTDPDWKRFFSAQGEKNGDIIAKLGGAALDAANGFKAIVEVARPFTDFVVDGIAGMAKHFGEFENSKEGRKSLLDFLSLTETRMLELKPVVVDIAAGLVAFFGALNQRNKGSKDDDFTTWFNKGLQNAAHNFRILGEQAQDPNGGFQRWLRNVRPLLSDVVGFISAAGRFFGRLFSDPRNINEASKTLKEISTQWLPQLADIFGKLSQSGLVSKLAGAIGSVFTGLNDFFDHGGLSTLSVFASTLETAGHGLSAIAGWISGLLTAFPALNGVAKVLGGTLAFIFGVALVAKISGIFGLVTNLIGAVKGIGNIGRSIRDLPDPQADRSKSRLTRFRQGAVDRFKDTVLPRDRGESAARRRTRETARADRRNTASPTAAGSIRSRLGTSRLNVPEIDRTGTGGVLPHLTRMEVLLQQIAVNTRNGGGGGGNAGKGTPPRPSKPGGGANSSRTRNRRSRTTELPERPRTPLDPVEFGPTAVPAGTDPNSAEGKKARRAAVEEARSRRTVVEGSGGATALGRAERDAERAIRDRPARFSPPSRSRLSRLFGGLGRGAAALGGALFGTGLDTIRPTTDVSYLPDAKYTYTQPQDPDTYRAPKAGKKRQTIPGLQDAYTVPLPAQRRDERGRLLPREPLPDSLGYEPYFASEPRKPGRVRRAGRGLLKGLGTLGSALGAPFTSGDDTGAIGTGSILSRKRGRGIAEQDDEFDDGYTAGFDDAVRELQGGSPGGGQQSGSRRGRKAGVDEEEPERSRAGRRGLGAVEEAVEGTAKGGGKGGLFSRLLRGGRGKGIAGVAEEGIEDVVKGGRLGGLARLGGGLLKGAAGGIGGLVAAGAAQFGGDYLIDKFVKGGKDRGSLSRGLGAVAQGAGIGATVGSFVPVVGTAIGGAIGGLAGGAYSLFKDKNLRNFVGGKISGAAKSVGNFFGGLFGGGDDQDQPGGAKRGGVRGFLSGIGKTATSGLGGAVATALGPLGLIASQTDIGKAIVDSLNKAGGRIASFFTKTIPDAFHKGVRGIETFFTKTLPSLPGKFFDAFFIATGRMIRFFTVTLPAATAYLFTKAIPNAAKAAWEFVVRDLWNPFLRFVEAIPGFFTKTIPHWFETAQAWYKKHVTKPVLDFITVDIPHFFTVTIPKWFEEAPHWFKTHVVDNVTEFFTQTLPNFFTKTLPAAIQALPGFLYDNLVQPILDFFKGIGGHIGDFLKGTWDWAKGLFTRAGKDVQKGEQGKMSGGLITGVYQGVEDTVRLRATPDEFVMRRSKVMEPGAKAILTDWNEGRIQVADLYKGLSANAAPQVMAMVPPDAQALTSRVSAITNNTVNHGPLMGDVTINNPVRERSETTLRRQIHIAAIRHRR